MADKVVTVKVDAKVDGAVAGIRKVKSSVDDLTKADLQKPQKAFDGLSKKAALMGGVVALGVGKAVSAFADFDQAMSAAGAATGAAGDELGKLRDLAVKAGQDTQFSATEAARGITEMAKAGVSAADILNGGLKGGLDLAAAGQLDVAQASEIAATALNQFGLKGSDVSHVADLYAAAAGKAQGSVQDIANAMKYAGVTASSMGISIEDATGVIGLFASKGIIGEQAGTSFRSMLLSLTSPSKIAAGAMEELGINVYDTSGKFVGMQGAAAILKEKLGPLDEATRNQALGQIFGNESMSAAVALYEAGGKGVEDWTKKVNDAGFAQEQAAKLTDNLRGDIERLGGSIETAFINSGSSANGALRFLTQGLEGVINVVSKIPGPLLVAGAALGGLALALPKGVSAYKDFTQSLDTMGLSMEKVTNKAPKLGGALRGLQGVAVGLTVASVIGGITNAFTELDNLKLDPQKLADGALSIKDLNNAMRESADLGAPFVGTLENFDQVLEATFSAGAGQNIDSFFAKINANFGFENTSDIEVAAQRFVEFDKVLGDMVSGGKADAAAQLFDQMAVAAGRQGISIDDLKAKLPGYASALANVGTSATGAAGPTGALGTTTDDLEKQAKDAEQALKDLKDAISGLGSPVADQMNAERNFQAAIDAATAAVKENGKTLDVNSEKGRANGAALETLRRSILDKVNADYTMTGSADAAAASMEKGREAFVRAAIAAGQTKAQAEALATKLGLVPKDVRIMVSQSGAAEVGKAIDYAARTRYTKVVVTTTGAYTSYGKPIVTPGSFATGGYTGPGGKYEPAGIVHKGEVVFEKRVVDREGVNALLALRAGKARIVPGYADGGLVGMSAYRQAPPPSLNLDRLVAAIGGRRQSVGPTINMQTNDPVRAAREVYDRMQWEAVNG